MKAVIIYSGKGGVGKTTTTANIARLLAKQGNKVFIIDASLDFRSKLIRSGMVFNPDRQIGIAVQIGVGYLIVLIQ